MYIDFEDYRPEIPRVERALSGGTAVLITWTIHALFVLLLIFGPQYLPKQSVAAAPVQVASAPEQSPRFVFVQPKLDIAKPQPKPDVAFSDKDRVMSSIEKAPDPRNAMPYMRGNTRERVEGDFGPRTPPRPPEQRPPAASEGDRPNPQADGQVASTDTARSLLKLPTAPSALPALSTPGAGQGSHGILGEAIRNLQRYTQNQRFDNPQGSGQGQGLIQFDSKGVDFGPWLARFVAQVKRNWFIPSAAMIMKGHVVITFNVHRDGTITRHRGEAAVDRGRLHARRGERADLVESDAAAAAGVPVGHGVLHRDVSLQRDRARGMTWCRRARSNSGS